MQQPILSRLLLVACAALAALPAFAADVWSEPHPGVQYLHRSTSEPKEIHALIVDLSRPEIRIRTTKEDEKGRTPSSFANLVGAVAAVNADYYVTDGSFTPVGYAIGEGTKWRNDTNRRFLACAAHGASLP